MTAKTRQAESPEDVEPWVEKTPEAAGEKAEADTEDTAASEEDEDEDEAYEVVRWKPGRWSFEERTLRKSDLVAAGVSEKDAKELTWNYGNRFSIPTKDLSFLSDDQFEALVERDPDLEVVTVED
jgi:hypothetical protein